MADGKIIICIVEQASSGNRKAFFLRNENLFVLYIFCLFPFYLQALTYTANGKNCLLKLIETQETSLMSLNIAELTCNLCPVTAANTT